MGVLSGDAPSRAPSPRCSTSVSGRITHRSIGYDGYPVLALESFNPVSARDDGFDELAVRLFVALLHQLGERPPPVGGLVVHAIEVERSERIVVGTDHEHT